MRYSLYFALSGSSLLGLLVSYRTLGACGRRSLQDGGDAFQGARAAAALATIALVLALTFPDTAAVPDFRAQGSVGKVGTGA